MLKFLKYCVPVILYASLIFTLSSFPHIPQPKLFPNADKVIHLFEYAILTLLLARAIGSMKTQKGKIQGVYFAVIIASLYGISDEIHQAFVPGRDCNLIDWFSDLSGVLLFLIIKLSFEKKRR